MKRAVVFCLFGLLAACGSDGPVTSSAVCTPVALPGDLVITEVMVNAVDADAGQEWLELYNASDVDQCLNGMVVLVQGTTTSKRTHNIQSEEAIIIPAKSYAVLGAGTETWLDYSWAMDATFAKGAFFDTSATISLKYGTDTLDSIGYGEVEEPTSPKPVSGVSLSLCAECTMASCNNDITMWTSGSGDTGEKYDGVNLGSPGAANGECSCTAPEGVETIRAPVAGDLVFTEVYANTAGAEDTDREWFEVHVVAQDAALDLTGLSIIKEKNTDSIFTIDTCYVAGPGEYIVFGRNADREDNGDVDIDVEYSSLTLGNSNGYLALLLNGETLAEVDYASATDGKSLQYDEANMVWCDSKTAFGDGEGFGTPGDVNFDCTACICIQEGEQVVSLAPGPGDLVITEILANTPGSEDAAREWFEVYVAANSPIDLNCLEIWKDETGAKPTHVVEPAGLACVRVSPGQFAVLAKSDDPAINGLGEGLVDYVYEKLTMANSGHLALRLGGTVVDAVDYSGAADGVSLQLDLDSDSWCDAVAEYWQFEDESVLGTPGADNYACGTVFCEEDGQMRPVNPPGIGDLVINEIFANPDGNDTTAEEWVELYVTPQAIGRDANGIELLVKGASKGVVGADSDACIPILQNQIVLAKTDDPADNGGLPPDALVVSGMSLANSDTMLAINIAGKEIDSVFYTDSTDGQALQLDPHFNSALDNDDPANWCFAEISYSDTNKGTPGEENPACGSTFCQDVEGTPVEVVWPEMGALVITEIFSNTKGNEDTDKEWFEVLVPAASSPFQMNGLGLLTAAGDEPDYYFDADQCIELTPGSIYVFCRNANPMQNGGLPACIEYNSVTLTNDYGFLGLGVPGSLFDVVADYGKSSDGISRNLDPDAFSTADNDIPSNWCNTPDGNTFGDGTVLGTPGVKNPECPEE